MHAFDLSKIDGDIVVRMARDETLKLLDSSEVTVDKTTLVIADQSKVLAMAGIMGGDESSVGNGTSDILFESAWFNPLAIAGKARNYGKHTDSSHRFERGVDSELQVSAIERATALMLDICGGNPGPVSVTESAKHLPTPATIRLRDDRLAQQLGVSIAPADVDDMLMRLGLILVERNNESSVWLAPSWRFDLAIEQDLVEEVARIYGYNNLPTSTPMMALELEPNAESVQGISLFRAQLVGRGYQEVITYSFVDPELQKMIEPNLVAVPLVNPISADMGVMRTSLWPGLLNTAVYNLNRQQSRVRIFEVGQCFVPGQEGASSLTQNTMLGGLLCGSRSPIGWTAGKDKVDFYDIKGDIEGLTGLTGLQHTFSFNAAVHPALHPGQCAQLTRNGEAIGWVGQLHPRIKSSLGIDPDVYLFQIDADKISEVRIPIHEEVSKFPEVKRDLAFFVEASIGAQTLIDHAKNVAGDLLVGLKLFDVYQSKDVENKGKSIALGLTFQHSSRTLTDEEVSQAIDRVVSELAAECKAELRA